MINFIALNKLYFSSLTIISCIKLSFKLKFGSFQKYRSYIISTDSDDSNNSVKLFLTFISSTISKKYRIMSKDGKSIVVDRKSFGRAKEFSRDINIWIIKNTNSIFVI